MIREIIKIDEERCNGCGLCVPTCHEGAIQVIDDKLRLISDLMCDGLGACLGHCPEGALSIEKREAQPYHESKVMSEMVPKGKNTVIAHLKHLKEHGEYGYLNEGIAYLKNHKHEIAFQTKDIEAEVTNRTPLETEKVEVQPMQHDHSYEGCPGSKNISYERENIAAENVDVNQPSELRQWPVQMHLINPTAPFFQGADVVIAADCVAFSLGIFHSKYLKGKSLAIACPKLDSGQETYVEKIKTMIDEAKVNTIQVIIMEVPCCGGLMHLVQTAVKDAQRKVPVKLVMVGIQGNILNEYWV